MKQNASKSVPPSSSAGERRPRIHSRSRARGAALVEYALLIVAISVGAGFAIKGLGKDVTRGVTEGSTVVKSTSGIR